MKVLGRDFTSAHTSPPLARGGGTIGGGSTSLYLYLYLYLYLGPLQNCYINVSVTLLKRFGNVTETFHD